MKEIKIQSEPLNSKYSLPDYIRLFWSFFITKIFFSKARLIRQPTRIRGFSNIILGQEFTTGQFCRIEAGNRADGVASLVIGDNVQINDRCHIAAINRIVIGDNVLIASNVFITDHDHGTTNLDDLIVPPANRSVISSPVTIEKNVWLGENTTILKGVFIGESSIVAAGAVVNSDVPAFSVVGGIPARVIKTLLKI